jgi:nucleotide-binding universal stress UspA family protein
MSASGAARVVVGVDGAPSSRHALRWAASLAATYGARIEAVSAWEYPQSLGWAGITTGWDPEKDQRQVLEDTVTESFAGQRPAGLELHVREGGAARVLLDASKGALMVVVGSRGHGGFTGMLLGSVSASVAEHASCPVFIVHGDHEPPAPA